MDKIVLKHTRIEINNYDIGDCAKLENIFSVWDPMYHVSNPMGIEYDSENRKLIIPRGVDIPYIENLFCSEAVIDKHADPYIDTDPIPIKYLARDEDQVETLKFLLGMDKYKNNVAKSQLSVNNNTGTGKTFVSIATICFTGRRAIIITSSIGWLDQWREKIKEYTPLKDDDIYTIAGSQSIYKIMCKDPKKYTIFLASHSTLLSYAKKHGWEAVHNLFCYIKCGLKIYDEAHLYFDNMCAIDFHTNTKRTIYLTATPMKSDRNQNQVYQLYFKNIPSIDLFDPDEDPHTYYTAIHFNSHPTSYDLQKFKSKSYGLNRIAYTNYLVEQESFIQLLLCVIDMCMKVDGKILMYVGTNKAIKEVYDTIVYYFPFLKDHIGIYTSITKENKEDQLLKKIILSTTKSCGAAKDIANLAMTVNLDEPFKSPVLARQTLGRTRGNNTMYLDIVDTGNYYTKNYYKEKKPIFNRYAKGCSDVIMSDKELLDRSEKVLNKYENSNIMCMRIYKE